MSKAAKAAFGEGQVVKVDGINGEFGFVTEPMTERAFEDAKDKGFCYKQNQNR